MTRKIFQISSEVNIGSVGKIAEQIGEAVLQKGWSSYIAYGRDIQTSTSELLKIGSKAQFFWHVLYTRLTDLHGFCSVASTKKLIKEIQNINPDIIHLQHLHGYFINIDILFNFLKTYKKPIVWTFHDCWSFTGHCAHYEKAGCEKWKTHCHQCPQTGQYPKSWGIDNSKYNFKKKKELFTGCDQLTIVPVSEWLGNQIRDSFFKEYPVKIIKNGIDLNIFKKTENYVREKYNLQSKFIILGVAFVWNDSKGFESFIKLAQILDEDYQIILVGVTQKQMQNLPKNIIALERIVSQEELAGFYSAADVFFNPTLQESLGLTNMEAIACGTPVITYKSGGASETVCQLTGFTIQKNDLYDVVEKIKNIKENKVNFFENVCRETAKAEFDAEKQHSKYIELYEKIIDNLDKK